MNLTDRGLEFIAAWEGGCLTKVYRDVAGYPTIGVGHLITDAEHFEEGREYDRDMLMGLFREDIKIYENAVDRHVKVPLEPWEFDALVSWTFNLGESNLSRSTMLRKLNASQRSSVPGEMARWNRAGGREVYGLTRRREAEGVLFSAGVYQEP